MSRYHIGLEKAMKSGGFLFARVDGLNYKNHKISFKRDGSDIYFLECLKITRHNKPINPWWTMFSVGSNNYTEPWRNTQKEYQRLDPS